MKRVRTVCALSAALLLPVLARAEDPPPSGPAQIFQRQADHQDATDRARNEAPEGHADGHAADSQAHRVLREPEMASAVPASDLAKGTIQIDVAGPDGKPLAGAKIVLGVMASMGGRSEQQATTDAEGSFRFTDLPVGSAQAYRPSSAAHPFAFQTPRATACASPCSAPPRAIVWSFS
jgi:hypothetical protein